MDFDLPTDLIHKAQIGFREDAGVSSFDPKDTTLPSIPTVEASISALDPSPPYLRCKYCKGRLLRGLQSLICIYCGQYQKKDLNPDPISFNSTNGYRWLLQSLNLNGLERVGPLAEGSGMNGGQSPAEDEITLSELLDLYLSWRDEPEKPKSSFDSRNFEHSSSPLNFSMASMDNFFTGSERAMVSDASEEQPVASKNDQSKDFGNQENLSLFQNVSPPETAFSSSIDVNDDASSGWNAEFQSVDSKLRNEDSKSIDPFVGAEADLSAHMDSVFGHVEDLDNRKLNDDSHGLPSTGNDWIQDDLFANMSSATVQRAEQIDSVAQAKDGFSDHPNDASLEGAYGDWFTDGNWQKSSANDTAVSNQAGQLDLDAKLKDGPSQDKLNDSSSGDVYVDWFENANWQRSNPINPISDVSSFDIKPKVNALPSPALVDDLMQNDILNDDSSQMSRHADGSDFDNSNKHQLDPTDWFQDSQWQIGASSATNIVASKDDFAFDEWNDFTSSTGKQNSYQDSWKQSGNEIAPASKETSELGLFPSTTDPHFSQSDLFSGSASNKNPNDPQAVYNILSEVSTASRDGTVEGEGPKNNEITTTGPKNDVEMLVSQMHDLSFMLKSELSIPSKTDDVGPSPSSHS